MLLVLLGVVASVAAQSLSVGHWWWVWRQWSGLTVGRRRYASWASQSWPQRVASVQAALPRDSWAWRLCLELRQARTPSERLAMVNQGLDDLAHELARRDTWPGAANRLTLLCHALLAAGAVVWGQGWQALWLLPTAAAGLFVGGSIQRLTRAVGAARRRGADALAVCLVGELEGCPDGAAPARRSWRYRRRRG